MKVLKIIFFSSFLFFPILANAQNNFAQTNSKKIIILATGGTISGAGESSIESKYSSSKIDIEKIVKEIPGITKFADIEAKQIMQIASQDMNVNNWLEIAKEVNQILAKRDVDGVVITHGTDTMEETAYFLNLVVKSKKPVILTGAMRPATSISADGALNLYNAVALAANNSSFNKGVLVLMNDEIFAARDVAKTNATNVASFKALNSGAIGFVHYGKAQIYYSPLRLHSKETIFDIKKLNNLPKVEILYAYAGSDAAIVEDLIKLKTKALVLAGVGDGNVNKETLQKLIEARKQGIIVIRSSHLGAGSVQANVEINDDEFGFITADNLSPQKARILAMLALTKTDDVKKIQEFFYKY